LKELRSSQPHLALLLQNIIDGVNSTATQLNIDPNGKVSPPPSLEALNVVANNGTVHATLTHNAPINKNIRYFVEADTDPSFSKPHVFDLGTSRSLFTSLPNKNGDGDVKPWHFRSYAQYSGSDATEKTYFGDAITPTAVTVGGTAQFTPMPSTGSGTAAPDGQQPGTGLGPVQIRAEVGPKRSPAP
jgi:hypothetical protein